MEGNAAPTEPPVCNIDKRPENQTYISAWRDRSEFQSVYEKIFNSRPDDIETKEDALRWLKMWRTRQMKEVPICVRCTFQILEAQVFDLRSRRAASDEAGNAMEIKNIYAGAFTRFINFLTEGGGTRKKSIADSVREIGIETYLVELRHLCAHRSVSISIDVFRRSAQYCMDWLKRAYWQRELSGMQPVSLTTLKYCYVAEDQLPDMSVILRTYDAVTAARVRRAYTLEMAIESVGLAEAETKLLEVHAQEHRSVRLPVIVRQTVRLLRELPLPATQTAVNAVCKAVLEHCRRMFADAVRYGDDEQVPLGKIHSELFRTLAAMGCLQTLFEQLMVICEQEQPVTATGQEDQRPWAKYWAHRIAFAYQLLKEFKKACRTWPVERLGRFGGAQRNLSAKQWYAGRLKSAVDQHLMLGFSVDCPWHMKLSRAYVLARLTAMNDHTKDIVPVLLALLEPPLSPTQQQKIRKLTEVYNSDALPTTGTSGAKGKAKGSGNGTKDTDAEKVYTADDVMEVVAKKRAHCKPLEVGTCLSKKVKRYGPWTDPDVEVDWSTYPLGSCPT
ncbi:uncharacterized protein LOC121594022 [Anopheles merus]|uniref:uncharacterized protein LOC121594022 n=1 Tax=Anopheles merus TaxID=30066 RepID=UPI001BE4C482|nr:uncharacterized protein LOC121594022 [Anopheles merus]